MTHAEASRILATPEIVRDYLPAQPVPADRAQVCVGAWSGNQRPWRARVFLAGSWIAESGGSSSPERAVQAALKTAYTKLLAA